MAAMMKLSDREWRLVRDLFDPPGREGRPSRYSRRRMVDAVLFLARSCYPTHVCQARIASRTVMRAGCPMCAALAGRGMKLRKGQQPEGSAISPFPSTSTLTQEAGEDVAVEK